MYISENLGSKNGFVVKKLSNRGLELGKKRWRISQDRKTDLEKKTKN